MTEAFDRGVAFVEHYEGDWSDDSLDPGGKTKFGITWRTYQQWARCSAADAKSMIRHLTRDKARRIYYELYWQPCKCDDIAAMGSMPGVALVVFDIAINQGPGRAGKFLQRALNRNGAQLKVDGGIGPKTLAALRVQSDPRPIIRDLTVIRILHYTSLTHLMARFGFGWLRRAVDCAMEAK